MGNSEPKIQQNKGLKQEQENHFFSLKMSMSDESLPHSPTKNRLLQLDVGLKQKIAEYLNFHEVYKLQSTCKHLYFEKLISANYCALAVKQKFKIFEQSNIFLQQTSEHISHLFEDIRTYPSDNWVNLLKQDYLIKQQLKKMIKHDNNIDQLTSYLEVPQIPSMVYVASDHSDYCNTQFQDVIDARSNQIYLKQQQDITQDCLETIKSGIGLLELRHQIIGEYFGLSSIDDHSKPVLINIIHSLLYTIYVHCLWIRQILSTCELNEDRLYFTLLFWNMYQGSIQSIQKQFQIYIDQLDTICDSLFGESQVNYQTFIEFGMVKIWCSVIMCPQIQIELTQTFLNLLTKNLAQNDIDKPSLITLQNYQSYLVDLSTTLHTVNWLGHSEFQAPPHLTSFFEATRKCLIDHSNSRFQTFQDDLKIISFIFPQWIIENYISLIVSQELQSQNESRLKLSVKVKSQQNIKIVQTPSFGRSLNESFTEQIDDEEEDIGDYLFSDLENLKQKDQKLHSSHSTQASTVISQINSFFNSNFQNMNQLKEHINDLTTEETELINTYSEILSFNQLTIDKIYHRNKYVETVNRQSKIPLTQSKEQQMIQDYFYEPKLKDIFQIYRKQSPPINVLQKQSKSPNLKHQNLADYINQKF